MEHCYLWDNFKAFGFPPGFIDMIKVLYEDIESILKINGGLSFPFKVERGIRQGCSKSGMSFNCIGTIFKSNKREYLWF